MTSSLWHSEPLLEKGFYYLVKSPLFHLTEGMRVRVVNAQYHQAPKSDDGGYIIEFPDLPSISLDHLADAKIIQHISTYLEKQERFDWDQAMKELKHNFMEGMQQAREEEKEETTARNKSVEKQVHHLVTTQGMTPREAYELLVKQGKLR